MTQIPKSVCECSFCNRKDHFRLVWNEIKIPEGWRYRTRSFSERPVDDIEVACPTCLDALRSGLKIQKRD